MSIVSLSSSSTCLRFTIQSHRHGSKLNLTQTLPFPSTNSNNRRCHVKISRDIAVYSGDGFGSPPPPLPETPWPLWVAGVVISAILSIWKTKNKWGPLLMLKQKVEEVVDVVEDVAEMVETAAERVDKVAEEVAEHLPEGSKLQKAALFIENAAERVAKDADFAGDIIDKVEEMEDELGSIFKPYEESKEEDDDDDAKEKNKQNGENKEEDAKEKNKQNGENKEEDAKEKNKQNGKSKEEDANQRNDQAEVLDQLSKDQPLK